MRLQNLLFRPSLELSNSESTKQVALAALEAIETERVSKLFAGGLNWATSFMRLLGQPTLAAGTTGAEYLASRGAEEAGWYEFKGSIDSAISKAALIEKLRLAAR
jgi:hypothetical protein